MNDYIIFKDLNGKYLTLPDILKENEEKHKNQVFYVTDEKEQSQYIEMFKKEGINAVLLKHNIDAPFITRLEQKNPDSYASPHSPLRYPEESDTCHSNP